jgi:hypothetical protein
VTGPHGSGAPAERTAIVRELMDRYGSIDYARRFVDALSGLALAEFRRLFNGFPASKALEFLFNLVADLCERTRRYSHPARVVSALTVD